ncbi:histidinol-phosphate transaminase [Streptococcus sp. FT1-106]|uniref:histidinol-phosphate transaminase n=1 Tax=Streptococcus sp. FT1-106 TaxID=3409994 RepID=UPI003BF5083F
MSTFLAKSFETIVAYNPGEQLGDDYLKLNANESSQEPSPRVLEVLKNAQKLNYYNDPFQSKLRQKLANVHSLEMSNILVGTGADDVLDLIFRTFFERGDKIAFPKITYSFYKGYADTFGNEALEVPLTKDLQVDLSDYEDLPHAVLVVNPDAPTGFLKPLSAIKKLVASYPERLVIVDEAYIDFGGELETAISLVNEFSNVIVVRTFSKSRQLAGARIGYAVACKDLIKDMEDLKMTVNPFNISLLQEEVALASLEDEHHFEKHIKEIITNRDFLTSALQTLDFTVLNSKSNFVYASSKMISGVELYEKLRARHILIRHYAIEEIKDFVRISIGTKQEMQRLVGEIEAILKEKDHVKSVNF